MRMIDADAFFNDFSEIRDYEWASQEYEVDAEPIRHGHWNEAKDGTLWCSVCTSTAPYEEDSWGYVLNAPHYDYCPYCGAKMDGGVDDAVD